MRLRHRYSKEDFLTEYHSHGKAGDLTDELAADVQEILHEVISAAVDRIVEQLNGSGHNLRHYDAPVPGAIALRDDSGKGAEYRCDLRLAVDTVVSVGFRDTMDPDVIGEVGVDSR